MPAFIKTPSDEKKWNAIKHSVAKQRGKSTENFTDRDWATVNAAWHKSEGNLGKVEEIKKSLMKPSIKMPNAMKMPKTKTGSTPVGKASLVLKNEGLIGEKQSSIEKLKTFLQSRKDKR